MSRLADLMRFEVLRTELQTIADEMAIRIMRSSFSPVIRDLLDFSTAICSPEGAMIAQGFSLPLHLGAVPRALEATLAKFPGGLADGDLVMLNDPYAGGMHLPDIFIIAPAYEAGALVAYTVSVAHQTDIGGRVPGGSATDNREIFEEGIRLPPVLLRQGGAWNEALRDVLRANVRLPDALWSDVEAQVAACMSGADDVVGIIRRHGRAAFEELSERILRYSREALLAEINRWPAGTYTFTDYEDHDGFTDRVVPIVVTVTIDSSGITFDFTGTSEQVPGSINCTLSYTESACFAAVRALCPDDIPVNAGFLEPIRVIAPEGTLLHARFPVGVAARGIVGYRIIDAIFGALSDALPDRVPAAGDGGTSGIRMGGYRADGTRFQLNDIVCGSWGARPLADGLEGAASMAVNLANRSVEIAELEDPVRIHAYEFVADSGGPGRYRGGLAIRRVVELLADNAVLSLRTHRRTTAPYGLRGGLPGSTSETYLHRDGNSQLLPAKVTLPVRRGDVVEHITASGGGVEPPHEREPQRIAHDLDEQKITPQHAASVYGYEETAAASSAAGGTP